MSIKTELSTRYIIDFIELPYRDFLHGLHAYPWLPRQSSTLPVWAKNPQLNPPLSSVPFAPIVQDGTFSTTFYRVSEAASDSWSGSIKIADKITGAEAEDTIDLYPFCDPVALLTKTPYRTEAPGLHWLLNLLGDAMFKAGVLFGEDLVLFRKSVLTLKGVAADVSEDLALEQVLPLSGALVLAREWASRCVAPPMSRDFQTHFSNIDLLFLSFAAPSAMTRFCTDRAFDRARRVTSGHLV